MSPLSSLLLAVGGSVVVAVAAFGEATAEERPLPAVRAGHPRLLVTSDDLPRLKAQAAAYPDEWARMQDAATWAVDDPGYGAARALRNASLVYLITGEEKCLKHVVEMAELVASKHKMDTYATPEALFGMALAYDWCYSALTESQRAEMADAMLRMAEHCDTKIWRHSDFNNHFLLEKVWPFTYVGLALHGDVTDPRVDDYLRRADQFIHEQMLPAANYMAGTTGGQFEGYGYDSWGYARPLAYILEGWRTGTGEDLFPQCTAPRNFAVWNLYGRRPDGGQEHFDDADVELEWGEEDNYVYLFARRYQDGRAQWMGDQLPRKYQQELWPIVLWRDPKLTPAPPDDLPTARRFDPLGWVLMRSSWQDDATFASFQCGPFLTGHQHLDNNAFTIYKGGLLAIDPGINAYGESIADNYRANYYSRSIAHNTITVYDPKETFPGGSWAGDRDTTAANDGGQMRMSGAERVQEVSPGDRWHVGQLTAYAHGDQYTYAVGDATKSYSPEKLSRFVRHFLYLPPNLFVIFDEVESTDASFRKTWLLHTIEEPKTEGGVTAIADGEGKLTVRTVMPEQAHITAVGGPGKECWVDGKNWPSLEKKEWPPEAGAWRLEVSPSKTATKDVFLHVLQTGDPDIARTGTVVLARAGNQLGVRVKAQGNEYVVLFSPGGTKCHLTIRDAGGKTVLDQEVQ
jgi:hypothetical protein